MNILSIQNALAQITQEELREYLQDCLAIIRHKIKFVEKSEVFIADKNFEVCYAMKEVLELSGGKQAPVLETASKIICMDPAFEMSHWVKHLATRLDSGWKAFETNQVYLIDFQKYNQHRIEDQIQLVEDLAEILYPGLFIFGGDGQRWIPFQIN